MSRTSRFAHRPSRGPARSLLAVLFLASLTARADWEQELPEGDWKRLDSFEGHTLAKADQDFKKGVYREAAAEYDAFIREFPESRAIPYALLRRGRCLQLDDKRFQAVREYQEILDYFPNLPLFAAAAMYYIGACHSANGDVEKAMRTWGEMVRDAEYRKHPLAAHALNSLGGYFMKLEKYGEAVEYYKQVAIDFKHTNQEARRNALPQVIGYYVRSAPDQAKLREFYEKTSGFEHAPTRIGEDAATDRRYWQQVWESVNQYGSFNELQVDARKEYYAYWARQMDGKFPDWDEFRIQLANFWLAADGYRDAWFRRLDEQFKAGYKPGDFDRVLHWISLYRSFFGKVDEYYRMFDFQKMTPWQIMNAIRVFYAEVQNGDMARNMIAKVPFERVPDGDTARFLRDVLWHYDPNEVAAVCARFNDAIYGKSELLECYYWLREHNRGITARQIEEAYKLADELTKVDGYAGRAWWIRAQNLEWDRKFEEAIRAYHMADNPTANLWRIVDCYLMMAQVDKALGQLREIENFFKNEAPRAALRIAYVYRDTGDKARLIAALRAVLKKYPGSGESSAAHVDLERMGVSRIDGGVDAE